MLCQVRRLLQVFCGFFETRCGVMFCGRDAGCLRPVRRRGRTEIGGRVGAWFAGMVGVSGRWWWGKPHPTSLYKHRRLYRERYPLPDPPPLRASPCRGGGSSAAGIRAVNVCAEWCAEAHPMVVCWVARCALTQPTRSEWGSCLAFRSSFCRP